MDDLLAKFPLPEEPQSEEEFFAKAVASGHYRSHIIACESCDFKSFGIVQRGRELFMDECPICDGRTSYVLSD